MNNKKLTLVSANVDEIKNIIGEVVGKEVDNKLQAQEDRKKKEEHINKVLKKDEMVGEKRKQKVDEQSKKHVHSCPSCQATFEKLGDGFEICKDCGTTDITLKKGEKMAACNSCGGVIPESFINIGDKSCPHCGSTTGAHWIK